MNDNLKYQINQKRLRCGRILFVHHRPTNTRDRPVDGQFRLCWGGSAAGQHYCWGRMQGWHISRTSIIFVSRQRIKLSTLGNCISILTALKIIQMDGWPFRATRNTMQPFGRTKAAQNSLLTIRHFCNMTMGIKRFCIKLSDLNIKFYVYLVFNVKFLHTFIGEIWLFVCQVDILKF